MPKKWTGEIVKELHNNEITQTELAKALGWSIEYVSVILNGKRDPAHAQEKMRNAIQAIIAKRKENEK